MAKTIHTKTICVEQPIGTFYIGCVNAADLRDSVNIYRRGETPNGVQRDLMEDRVREIIQYCDDPDATFPTAIIISIDTSKLISFSLDDDNIKIVFSDTFGDIIDGQHRLKGIWNSGKAKDFNLPVIFMIDPTIEERAYVFSIINSKQTKVSPSLIYELFDVSTTRSPQKTVHEIARAMNSRKDSPFYNRLKMLGKKDENQKNPTLSQGTFAKRLLRLITKDAETDRIRIKRNESLIPDNQLIFRKYFIEDRDDIILKMLLNCFSALKNVFSEQWENSPKYILWKTTGFNAVIDGFPKIFEKGKDRADLSEFFFEQIFLSLKKILEDEQIELTGEKFGSNEQHIKELRKYIERAVDEL